MVIQAKIHLILFGKPNLGFYFNQNLFNVHVVHRYLTDTKRFSYFEGIPYMYKMMYWLHWREWPDIYGGFASVGSALISHSS
jgi:hypothetical protein